MKERSFTTGKMVRLAVLVAIIIIMAVTPLGFLMVGPIAITLMMIPVAVAAIVVGPMGGAIAGATFGMTSFLRGFGISPLSTALMNQDPIFTFILLVGTRILAGLITGLIYRALCERKNKTVASMAACLAAPVLNTVFFVSTLVLLFSSNEFVTQNLGASPWAIVVTIVTVNAVIEAGVGFVVGSAISRTLVHLFPGRAAPRKAAAT
ncbi:MAG: ECF transporter S component [Oscillospiraceae bacterium]|nr:ECF transporter S component [Oscillospiraceae bacterium]